jgi:hypothetical protein
MKRFTLEAPWQKQTGVSPQPFFGMKAGELSADAKV